MISAVGGTTGIPDSLPLSQGGAISVAKPAQKRTQIAHARFRNQIQVNGPAFSVEFNCPTRLLFSLRSSTILPIDEALIPCIPFHDFN